MSVKKIMNNNRKVVIDNLREKKKITLDCYGYFDSELKISGLTSFKYIYIYI